MKNGAAHPTEEVVGILEDLISREFQRSSLNSGTRQQAGPLGKPYPSPGYTKVFGNLPISNAIMANNYPPHIQAQQLAYFQLPVHLSQSLITIENSPLARAYTDYFDAARQRLANGMPSEEVLGPEFTDVELFFRERRPSDFHTASTWASELSKSFTGVTSIPVQLAGIYLLRGLMRWTIAPSQQTYADMPLMIRPTPSQRLVPHSGQVDLCALSPVRDALINKMRDFVTMMIDSNVTCNWPHLLSDCIESDRGTGHRRLTHSFEEHVAVFDNWTLDSTFLYAFPELDGSIGIKDE